MRRPGIVKQSGPYQVKSRADGSMLVIPMWPQYPPYNDEDGGGPGLSSRMGLAEYLSRWLNAPYLGEPEKQLKAMFDVLKAPTEE